MNIYIHSVIKNEIVSSVGKEVGLKIIVLREILETQ